MAASTVAGAVGVASGFSTGMTIATLPRKLPLSLKNIPTMLPSHYKPIGEVWFIQTSFTPMPRAQTPHQKCNLLMFYMKSPTICMLIRMDGF